LNYRALRSACVFLIWVQGAVCQGNTPKPPASDAVLASTPPLGWNSWDGYGITITEDQFKSNVEWFAKHLKPAGWQYVVIDMEWFVATPRMAATKNLNSLWMAMGATCRRRTAFRPRQTTPASSRLRTTFIPGPEVWHPHFAGIPKEAVEKNLPISGSKLHAPDVADRSDNCPWNVDNYGLDASKPGAQAYYDSIAKLYASWEIDLIRLTALPAILIAVMKFA